MQEPPTNEQLYWALGKLATEGPTREIRMNAFFLLARFTTGGAQPLGNTSKNLFDTIPTKDTFPTHRPPENIEQRPEAKNIIDESYRLAKQNRQANYSDPAFQCHGDYRECIESGAWGITCFGLFIVCLANKVIPLT